MNGLVMDIGMYGLVIDIPFGSAGKPREYLISLFYCKNMYMHVSC